VVGALEVVGVGGLGEPGPLAQGFAGGTAKGFGTEALPATIAGISDERIRAVQAFGERRQTGHRSRRKIRKKREKKEEKLALETEEDAAKKTHIVVDFKPAESVGFQNGADKEP